ncbi:unnamed protein product [Urochloa decumbens]|uniref:Uncharacterized protein n=1 Tax=Urochloa decumbens TaxID=240449 RepID=A0ABC8YXI3_9POAL
MDIAGMFRPALDKITSSIASSTARVLSFPGSFNDRTSPLLPELGPAAAKVHPAPPPLAPQEAAAPAPATTTVAHTFDVEAAPPLQATSAGNDGRGHEPDAESKRVAKSVYTVCLFVASASLVLFGNLPAGRGAVASKAAGAAAAAAPAVAAAAGESGASLYIADLAFISLGFFSSLGLSMFSIVARPGGGDAAVASVQKWGMVAAVASVIVAFALRMAMVLPAAPL